MTPGFPSRNLIESSRRGESVERDDVPEGISTSVGSFVVRITSQRPRAAGLVARPDGVLFENSIVCLVVLFLLLFFWPHFWRPVSGCGCFFDASFLVFFVRSDFL